MSTTTERPKPAPAHQPRAPGPMQWVRDHRRAAAMMIAAAIAVVTIVAVIAAQGSGTPKKTRAAATKLSTNPIVASYQKQLPALAAAVIKAPNNANAIRAYGVALYATGDVSRALTQYKSELKLSPTDAVLANNLGNVYRDLGTYDKALQSYQSSISLAPRSPTAYINLANLYNYTLKQPQLGITTIQAAQRNIPNSPDLGVLLGIAYEQTHDVKDATTAFQAVLRTSPGNPAATAGLARLPA